MSSFFDPSFGYANGDGFTSPQKPPASSTVPGEAVQRMLDQINLQNAVAQNAYAKIQMIPDPYAYDARIAEDAARSGHPGWRRKDRNNLNRRRSKEATLLMHCLASAATELTVTFFLDCVDATDEASDNDETEHNSALAAHEGSA